MQNVPEGAGTAPFAIEHHAVLAALFAETAAEAAGEAGTRAFLAGIARYGRERGARMAARAREHGDAPTPAAYRVYGEWAAESGLMREEIAQRTPELVTRVTRCEWCEAWKRHGLLEAGRLYCEETDRNLALGFNPAFRLRVDHLLSRGESGCEFHWGFEYTPEAEAWTQARREALGKSCVRDFTFHTAHLYDALSRGIAGELGEARGGEIAARALERFAALFGAEYAAAVIPR